MFSEKEETVSFITITLGWNISPQIIACAFRTCYDVTECL